ncbi:MAG: hypothetical protein J7K73_01580 [Nanoarchaeota archaeon]|nr:hypothetical protein [Nanoarchaeota archaeon]
MKKIEKPPTNQRKNETLKRVNSRTDIKTFRFWRTYDYNKKYVKPERYYIDLASTVGLLKNYFNSLIRSLQNKAGLLSIGVSPENLIAEGRNTLGIAIPDEDGVFNVVLIHYSRRKWYNTPSRAVQYLKSLQKTQQRIITAFKAKLGHVVPIDIITYVLVGNYTSTVISKTRKQLYAKLFKDAVKVRGRKSRTLLILRPEGWSWFVKLMRCLYKLYLSVISNILKTFEKKAIRPFGKLKENLVLRAGVVIELAKFLRKVFKEELPVPPPIKDVFEWELARY